MRTKTALALPAGFIIAICQEIGALACRVFQKLRGGYSVSVSLPHQLSRATRYVVAANHQTLLDPFVIFALLPPQRRWQLLPLKFMTIPKVYHRWYAKPFAYLLGCFPAHIKERHHHTYGVEGAIKLIGYGYNLCIFPEGRRVLRSESDPKPGVVKIIDACPDAQLLLAHLEWKRLGKYRRHVTLVVAPAAQNLDKTNPKAIMDAIYAL